LRGPWRGGGLLIRIENDVLFAAEVRPAKGVSLSARMVRILRPLLLDTKTRKLDDECADRAMRCLTRDITELVEQYNRKLELR